MSSSETLASCVIKVTKKSKIVKECVEPTIVYRIGSTSFDSDSPIAFDRI